jgi:hypothetical protein
VTLAAEEAFDPLSLSTADLTLYNICRSLSRAARGPDGSVATRIQAC